MNACKPVSPPLMQWEHANEFNRFYTTINGSNFNRDQYLRLMTDLMLAYGNFLTENPDSPFAPPGVDVARVSRPSPSHCAAPVRVKGLFNAEYNPAGAYDAITFCDGEPSLYFCGGTRELVDFCSDVKNIASPLPVSEEAAFAASYCAAKGGPMLADATKEPLLLLDHQGYRDPCRVASVPQGALLAFDYNGNGRRDYGEPVVNNGHERFDDVGVDGCADALEDGRGGCATTPTAGANDPNHDNYDVDSNAAGTERNWSWEQGEPFRDLGLDGVQGTGDFGEANGAFDMTGGLKALYAYDGRTNFRKLSAEARSRISVYGEGGIRDVFHFGLMAKHLLAGVNTFRAIGSDGRCCWRHDDGRRDCREHDDDGEAFNGGPGWSRECNSGTFWINRKGFTTADATPYGDAMFELFEHVEHVDASYRTLAPADVEAR